MDKKIILTPVLLIISIFIFIILDNGSEAAQINQLIQPIFFAITLTVSVLFSRTRKYLLFISLSLLMLLIFTYLLQKLEISNWVGSLGFGMLVITIFSYLPQFIKQGYIEEF